MFPGLTYMCIGMEVLVFVVVRKRSLLLIPILI